MMQMDSENLEVLRAMLAGKTEKENLLAWMNERIDLLGKSEAAVFTMASWLNDLWADPDVTGIQDNMRCAMALCLCLLTMRQVYGIGGKSFRKATDTLSVLVDGADGQEGGA